MLELALAFAGGLLVGGSIGWRLSLLCDPMTRPIPKRP